ncbi:TraX family protein [Latilactobacillus sakei]
MVIPTITLAENSIFLYIGVFFYLFRNNRLLQCLTIIVFAVINAGANSGFTFTGLLTTNTQWMMIFAIIPILLYNGQKGRSMKSFFYFFYPIHIWLLYILASFII